MKQEKPFESIREACNLLRQKRERREQVEADLFRRRSAVIMQVTQIERKEQPPIIRPSLKVLAGVGEIQSRD